MTGGEGKWDERATGEGRGVQSSGWGGVGGRNNWVKYK